MSAGSAGARVDLVPFDKNRPTQRAEILDLTGEYFRWMDTEIRRVCGFSIPDIVGMDLDDYVAATMDSMCAGVPPTGAFYLATVDGETVGMGGLRRLPDGAAEIVRIYTRPAHRGQGVGAQLVAALVEEARRFGYDLLRLDTGVFMESAQRIYAAAGFTQTDPYEGAEPPAALHPCWLYLQKTL